jgi:nucleoid-associated protein YgaU
MAVIAAFGANALARAENPSVDPVRQRAEELAEAASRRFTELTEQKHLAQAQTSPPAATRTPQADDPWTVLLEWLDRSNRDYQSIMRRLSAGSSTIAQAPMSPPAPKEAPPPAPAPTSKPETEAQSEGGDWLTRSSKQFQSIMRRLSEAAVPPRKWDPVAEAEKKSAAPAAPAVEEPERTAQVEPPKASPPQPGASPEAAKQADAKKAEEERVLAQTRRAEAAKREAEVKKTEEALKAEQARKMAEAKKAEDTAKAEQARKMAETKKAEDTAKAEQARKMAETKKAEDTAKAEEAKKAAEIRNAELATKVEQARKAAEGKKAERVAKAEEARKAGEARRAERVERTKEAKRVAQARRAGSRIRKVSSRERSRRQRSRSCESAGEQIEAPGWYVVQAGDTLWSIAHRHYGAGSRYRRIYAANRRHLSGPNRIWPCQRVYLPRPTHKA